VSFSDILGHNKQLEILKRSLEKDRLHHAYLFLGPEGVGKKTTAFSLAMAVQCLESAHDSCGGCNHCVRVQTGNHPDVRLVEPVAGKKEISIQQVRDLEKELSFRPFFGQKKIAILDPASLMNFSSQNAILKTLEEPPGDSLLILISTSTGELLPTLLSRCLHLSFAPLPVELVANYLISKKGLKQEEAESLAALTMGSLGKALTTDAAETMETRKKWAERLCALGQSNYREAVAVAEELSGAREESLKFLEWAQGWYRDVLIYRVTGSSQGICNLDMMKKIERQSAVLSSDRILSLLSEAGRAVAKIQRNVNRRMALENLFVDIVRAQ
jgi:DNA polymerase-3 subunit delta'